MKHLDERARMTFYNENVSRFEKFLEKDNYVTICVRNLRMLAAELYKTKEDLAATIVYEIFEQKNIQYNLRSQPDFQLGSVKQSIVV